MSADFWLVDPRDPEREELAVASCPTCCMVVDGFERDSIPYDIPFTQARLHGLSDDGLRSHAWNVTYNLSGMLREADFCGWLEFGIQPYEVQVIHMADTLATLVSDADRYRRMNPANGWGNYFGLVATLADFVKVAGTHPYMEVDTWL